jgi:phosphonatase-like hydrolase
MAGLTLLSCAGGRVVLPTKDSLLTSAADGGHLVVDPPRDVWERSELTAEELTQWSILIAATGRAMLDALPQLQDACVNYWEAGNWALNDAAAPIGPKTGPAHRKVHQHLIGRSRQAENASWQWGEAPVFPTYAEKAAWSAAFQPLSANECASVVRTLRNRLSAYGLDLPAPSLPSLVIFDMAGTTVEDDGQVPRAFKAALASQGITASDSDIEGVRGSSKREAIRRFVPDGPNRDGRANEMFGVFTSRLAASYESSVRAMPGARELFERLRAHEIKVALNTGFDREITTLLVNALGWNSAVDVVLCGDDVERGRPAPDLIRGAMRRTGVNDPSSVFNIGDTMLDLEAGSAAHVGWNVGVTSGAHTYAHLNSTRHTHIAPDVSYVAALFPDL